MEYLFTPLLPAYVRQAGITPDSIKRQENVRY